MKFEVYCQHEDFAMRLNFYIFKINSDESRDLCTSLDEMKFVRFREGSSISPTFFLSGMVIKPFLQAMADALKKIGINAKDEPVLVNELAAVQYHLEDMRTIVFNTEGGDKTVNTTNH